MTAFHKSPCIIHYDVSSCNGCDIEVLASLNPLYDAERFGVINTGNPKHADILVITGAVNYKNLDVIKQIYEQMPNPKAVMAVGICACSGGIFKESYNIIGGVDNILAKIVEEMTKRAFWNVYVPGCAAKPEAIIDGIIKAVGILEKKYKAMKVSNSERKEKSDGISI